MHRRGRKFVFAATVLVVALLAVMAISAAPAHAQGSGDVDSSGTVDDADIQAILRHLIGLDPQPFDASAGDIDGDGDVTLRDALLATDLVGLVGDAYADNLALIRAQSIRNLNHDDSPFRDTEQAALDISDTSPLLGPRADYLNNPNGNGSQSFPTLLGGNFRTECEFSHFAYDDPIVFPNQPGAAHLHMFFGNTDVNAYSTYETLRDTGGSTCNGGELNRTGYWAPAMIDGQGNVRIPERIVIYYKGYGLANGVDYPAGGGSQPYLPGMANLSPSPLTVPEVPDDEGGQTNQVNYKCSNNFSAIEFASGINELPNCSGDHYGNYPIVRTVLEMDIKFWNCFPTDGDVTDYTLWQPAGPTRGGWFYSNCNGAGGGDPEDADIYPSLEYFVNYVVEPGEDTSDWFLASDVDPASIAGTPALKGLRGSTHHADWWGGWHPDINQEWLDNCVNYQLDVPTGCGMGYLSDGGPDNANPLPGRALRYRPQYDSPGDTSSYTVDLETIFEALCEPHDPAHSYSTPMSGAWCVPSPAAAAP